MGLKIFKKRKYLKVEEFIKEMIEKHKEVNVALKKSQNDIKMYVNRNRRESVEYKVGDKMLLSTKDLVSLMKKQRMQKLMERFVGPYKIKKISENVVELCILLYSFLLNPSPLYYGPESEPSHNYWFSPLVLSLGY